MTSVSKTPAISVVMAVCNGQPYLREAVESILAQTFRDFEFVVVDDGSSDGSCAYLDEVARSDPRLRVLHQANRGLTKSLNVGLQHATGFLVARMDGDDIALPNRFALQKLFLDANPEVVMVGSEVMLITEDGILLGPRRHPRDHAQIRRQLLLGNGGGLTHPAVMIRKTALDTVGGYDEDFETAQDLDLFLRLSEVGKVHNMDEALLLWRQHPRSVNRTRSETWQSTIRMALRKSLERCSPDRIANDFFPDPLHWTMPDSAFGLAQLAASKYETKSALRLLARAIRQRDKPLAAMWQAVTLTVNAFVRRGKSLMKLGTS